MLLPMLCLLCACGFRQMLPQGPVLSPADRVAWDEERPSGASYTGPPRVDFPVLPLQVFGAAYELDLVLVSRHPDWNMHEYARLDTPDGPLWLAKDSREPSREQSLVAAQPDVLTWMPEIPLARRRSRLEVDDRSDDSWLDIDLRYDNIDGHPVEVRYEGRSRHRAMRRRNGSTMGHSRDQVLAVLDVSHRTWGRRASVRIDGREWPLQRVLGVRPLALALTQTQGGLSIGSYQQVATLHGPPRAGREELLHAASAESEDLEARDGATSGGRFWTAHQAGDVEIEQVWRIESTGTHLEVQQASPLRSLHYRFLASDDALELVSLTVRQWGREVPTCHIALDPALPDVRRPFEGERNSRYAIDVNGQRGHAVGTLVARWTDDGVRILVAPEEPWWTRDRALVSTITYPGGNVAEVQIDRLD